MTAREFEDTLRRYFRVDDLAELDIRRLYVEWQEFLEDVPRLRGLERQLRYENGMHTFGGSAWWEERNKDGVKPMRHADDATRVNLCLSCRAGFSHRVRPHCPERMFGHWQCVGSKKQIRGEFEPTTETFEWRFAAEGEAEVLGFPDLEGLVWCSIEASNLRIRFSEPDRRSHKTEYRIYEQVDPDEFHVVDMWGTTRMHMRRILHDS